MAAVSTSLQRISERVGVGLCIAVHDRVQCTKAILFKSKGHFGNDGCRGAFRYCRERLFDEY